MTEINRTLTLKAARLLGIALLIDGNATLTLRYVDGEYVGGSIKRETRREPTTRHGVASGRTNHDAA